MFHWTRQQRVTETAKDVGVTPKIAIDWYNFCRDICEEHFLSNPITIGGPGKTVEIDESKFGKYTYIFMTDLYTVLFSCAGKRKYNRGRQVDGHWVFGGIERGSSKAFMLVVPDRTKITLLPIIQQYIRPGTTIISDEWKAYHDIGTIPGGYTHKTVNHSQNFVDPVTGAHTQSIEGHWSCTKRMMRKQGVMNTSSDLFPSYMVECLWRRRYGDSDLFEKLMEHIKDKYPLL